MSRVVRENLRDCSNHEQGSEGKSHRDCPNHEQSSVCESYRDCPNHDQVMRENLTETALIISKAAWVNLRETAFV